MVETMLSLVTINSPNRSVLLKPAAPVLVFDEALYGILASMRAVMEANNGHGIAAPQVGVGLRAFVLRDGAQTEIINPMIVARKGNERRQEACLSLPGLIVEVERSEKIVINAQDRHGEPFNFVARGPVARVIQHEIDHLDGLLISRFA